jgi:hypothetical protein
MAKKPKKKSTAKKIARKPWTTANIRELKSLAKEKLGKEKIAKS